MTGRIWNILGLTTYLVGYGALLAWFKWIDVYHAHFEATGTLVLVYNIARVLFIFYLFGIVSSAGSLALRVAFGPLKEIDTLEHHVLSFFTGAGLWHIALLALGYLNLYTVPVAVAVTLPFVALSWPNVTHAFSAFRWRAVVGPGVSFRVTLSVVLVAIFGFLLLMTKGLYPAGGHDYFTHYFQYYLAVIDRGGIWPNEVWYHYYYSKGAGLFFLGMLLTDPLAPQLVTYCFMAAAAAALYLVVRVGASDSAWPWTAAALFLAMYINTPVWGEFEKQHEINTAFVIAIAWMWARALSTIGRDRAAYITGTAFAVIGAVIQNSTVAVFFGASFGILAVWFAIKRQFGQTILGFALASIAGATLVATFAINYVTTGLADDQTLLPLWRFADVEKLYQWGVLLPLLMLHRGKTAMLAAQVSFADAFTYFFSSMRFKLFFPLFLSSFVVCAAALYYRWRKGNWPCAIAAPSEITVLTAMTLVTVVLALTVGATQPVSFFRYSSLVIPIFLALGILIWEQPAAVLIGPLTLPLRDWRLSVATVSAMIFLIIVSPGRKSNFVTSSPIIRGWHFLTGTYSVDTAYMRQDDTWYPSGAIYPGARGAYAVAGPRTPIWSMNIQAYCMLPDCRVETVTSFTIGSGYDDVMFGSPEAGRAALQMTNHNYFLISQKLPVEDYLLRSPLFSPDMIANYLGIRWTDGTTTLLTWLGPDTKPLDAAWIAHYRKTIESSPIVQTYPYAEVQSIFAHLKATPHPWRSVDLPWIAKP
jgi:hypothetical protein